MPIAEDGSTVSSSFYSKTAPATAETIAAANARRLAKATRTVAAATVADSDGAARSRQVLVDVIQVQAGAALDGNAVVTVRWRGNPVVCEGYASSYTPVVGHRVVCDLIDNQLLIAYRSIGKPS